MSLVYPPLHKQNFTKDDVDLKKYTKNST